MTFVAPNLACGEARGGRIPFPGAVTDEQRCHRPNSAQPAGRQVFFAQTSLLAPSQPAAGLLRRSRLVWSKNPSPRTSSYLRLRPLSSSALPRSIQKLGTCQSGIWRLLLPASPCANSTIIINNKLKLYEKLHSPHFLHLFDRLFSRTA